MPDERVPEFDEMVDDQWRRPAQTVAALHSFVPQLLAADYHLVRP